ncbi:hypothetical protein BHU62_21385 [Serratia marcescens]|uniref:HPr kinase/phosphorylase C-terminal domain-containing protein n=1 Tax=Serratia marcescens TaxID=615 RepID=A0A1Q4NV14_SERMA|nr:hypothetical protein [Serratia marcescens]OKB64694.1 hypothetical protein BHU62_21385 [Serratia marcescens]
MMNMASAKVNELINLSAQACHHLREVDIYGIKALIQCERDDFLAALNEYFFASCAEIGSQSAMDNVKIVYSHSNELFFHALNVAAEYRVEKRVEFHPDNYYEVIFQDASGDILESRGGIRHLILRSASRQEYCVITPDYKDNVLEYQKPGIRLLREIVFRTYQSINYFPIHASASGFGSRGFLFVGDSGAGKTTMASLLAALADEGKFISSDITLLKNQSDTAHAVGWPGGGISVGAGTLACLSSVVPSASDKKDFKHREGYVRKGKYLLTPSEFTQMFAAEFDSQLSIDAIIFPRIVPEEDACHLAHLPANEAFERASQQLRNSLSDTYRYGLVDILGEDIHEINSQALENLHSIIEKIPAFTVSGNPVAIAHALINEWK